MKEYMLGLYEKAMPGTLTWREKLMYAKEAGFDFVEMSIDETDEKLARLDSSKKDRLEIIEAMHDIGIPIRTMCLSGHRKYPIGSMDKDTRNQGLKIMGKAIQLACDLGIRIIQLAGYDVYYEKSTEETRDFFTKNLVKCVEVAAEKGVILAFETMETEFMNTVEKSMYYVNKIQSPYLQIYPDIGNLTNAALTYNKNVLEDIIAGKGHIVAIHLKETVSGKFREIKFGTGHVDFTKTIQAAWSLGVRKYVVEFWYVGNENWMDELRIAKEFIADHFNQVIKDIN